MPVTARSQTDLIAFPALAATGGADVINPNCAITRSTARGTGSANTGTSQNNSEDIRVCAADCVHGIVAAGLLDRFDNRTVVL